MNKAQQFSQEVLAGARGRMEFADEFLAGVKDHMTANKITRTALADKMGVCRSRVSAIWRSRNPTMWTLWEVADALGLRPRLSLEHVAMQSAQPALYGFEALCERIGREPSPATRAWLHYGAQHNLFPVAVQASPRGELSWHVDEIERWMLKQPTDNPTRKRRTT